MAYTQSQVQQAVKSLQKYLPGLDTQVATVWVQHEEGINNPLGVTFPKSLAGQIPVRQWISNGSRFLPLYPNIDTGAKAAADRIKSQYPDIVASLGKSPQAQAAAIAHSRWNTGQPDSPYYTKMFTEAGLLTKVPGSDTKLTTPKTTPPSPTPTVNTTPPDTASEGILLGDILKQHYAMDYVPTSKIDDGAIKFLQNAIPQDAPGRAEFFASLEQQKGQPLNSVVVPKQLADKWMFTNGWVGIGPTNRATGQYEGPGSNVLPFDLKDFVANPIRLFMVIGGVLLIGAGLWIVVRGSVPSVQTVVHETTNTVEDAKP